MRVLVILALLAGVARADIGSVSPGKLATVHAAIESQCNRCHVPFGGIPASQCLGCHATLAERLARNTGFHITVKAQACTDCHKEHRGRDAALSPPPPAGFDHRLAVFRLDGKHAQLPCARCHPQRQWVGIASTCERCHADTAHKGTLGADCAKCHRAESWKPATRTLADHQVAMTGGHAKLACASCHASGQHLAPQQSCNQCHAQPHGGTKAACTTCHAVAAWQRVTYEHRFPPAKLPGKHQTATCLGCHPAFKFAPTSFECASCHDKQRPHEPLGACAQCHSALSWKTRTFDHDRPSIGFALTGAHGRVACETCHPNRSQLRATEKRTCLTCHGNLHGAQFGARGCADCHTTAQWRPSTITAQQHAAVFPLRDAHATVSCIGCHLVGVFAQRTHACSGCHADVRHKGRFGSQCESCHGEATWSKTTAFDHGRTGFALERGHANVACAQCHGQGGMKLVGVAAPMACQTCHAAPHGKQFGMQCTQCHSTASFKAVPAFDHASRTDFPLELRHATLACLSCHDAKQRPVVNRACRTCHGDPHRGSNAFDCSDCHRADRWRIIRFDHDLTSYPLVGRHRIASCGGCHTNPNWTGVRTDCVACHAFDRPRTQDHLTKITCDDCHTTTSWRTIHR